MALPRDATVQRPLEFGTKAETLARLRPVLHSAEILPLQIVERKGWKAGADATLKTVERDGWLKLALIVRSSARHEDKAGASQAGRFLSIPNVLGLLADLKAAIDRVFASYDATYLTDQVLIQPMLQAVDMSGVVFTSDPNSGSPYLVINYETEGDTAAVTGGKQSPLETHLHLNRGGMVPRGHRGTPRGGNRRQAIRVVLDDRVARQEGRRRHVLRRRRHHERPDLPARVVRARSVAPGRDRFRPGRSACARAGDCSTRATARVRASRAELTSTAGSCTRPRCTAALEPE